MKLTKSEKYVLNIIKAHPGVQNDEMRLLEAVYLSQGWDQSKSLYWNLTRSMHAETVARARRKLHELGLIEYSPEALRRRTKRFKQETERHAGGSVTGSIVNNRADVSYTVKVVDGELITEIR